MKYLEIQGRIVFIDKLISITPDGERSVIFLCTENVKVTLVFEDESQRDYFLKNIKDYVQSI